MLPKDWYVKGRFVDERGTPVSGISMTVGLIGHLVNRGIKPSFVGRDHIIRSTPSEKDGRFSLALPKAPHFQNYHQSENLNPMHCML